jgi:carbon-monoxide dehydrogenase medium subunit
MGFAVHHPASLAEAIEMIARYGDRGRPLAGGTDLVIQINRGRQAPDHLISLSALPELVGVVETADAFRIGAMTTHAMIEDHPSFADRLVALRDGARVIGGRQIRHVGTVGGNIANASPAADLVPVLLTLDASVELLGPGGATRSMSLDDFLIGRGQTALRRDELIARVGFAKPQQPAATAFLKAGRRNAMEISVVCVAALVIADGPGGVCRKARLALGAVGPRTLRAKEAERFLEGRRLDTETLKEAGRIAAQSAKPITDVRASASYRSLLATTLVERALARCVERLAQPA